MTSPFDMSHHQISMTLLLRTWPKLEQVRQGWQRAASIQWGKQLVFPYIGKVCYKSSPTNKMSSHTECSKSQPSGTRYKDTSVHMPRREQEAGLLHNRSSCFPQQYTAHGSTRRRKVTVGRTLSYAEALAGQSHSTSDSKWRKHGQKTRWCWV